MNQLTETVVTVLTLIVGVAILSVLVSRKSNTVGVIQAAASGFGNALGVATSPVTGASVPLNLGYGGNSLGNFPVMF
jgi:hypothetical protein